MSSILKRAPLALVLVTGLATLALHAPALAETFPTRSITIMPLLAAGTGLDVTVRLYAEQLSQAFASRSWSRTSRAAPASPVSRR